MGKCAALYDYDAQSEQELSFKAGDVISILDKDESGWWHGELNGRVGVFPAAEWVEEVRLLGCLLPVSLTRSAKIDENAPPAPRDAPGELKELAQAAELAQCGAWAQSLSWRVLTGGLFAVSLYDYAAQDEDELSIVEGEILNIEYEDSGWYIGSNLKGQSGRYVICGVVRIDWVSSLCPAFLPIFARSWSNECSFLPLSQFNPTQ